MKNLSFLLGAIALWLAGCDSDTVGRQCSRDADCGGSGVCDLPSRRCITPVSGEAVLLEVVPPSGNNQGWVVQEFPAARPDSGGRLRLDLGSPVSVQGRIYASDDPERDIPARVTAWRDSLLPGRSRLQVDSSTSEVLQGGKDGGQPGGTFVLWLEPGHEYTFLVQPSPPNDTRYPPSVTTMTVDDHLRHDFVLDGNDRAVRVEGQIRDALDKPLPFSVQVRALRPGTWIQSTVAQTCTRLTPDSCPEGRYAPEVDGQFVIRVPRGVAPYTLRVEPVSYAPEAIREQSPVPLIPSLECTEKVLGLVQPDVDPPRQKISSSIKLPPFAFAQFYTLSVAGEEMEDGDGEQGEPEPIVGAQLTASTTLEAKDNIGFERCVARYQYTAATDAEGKAELPLLPGLDQARDYELTVVSPPSSAYASQWTKVSVGASAGVLQTLLLSRRYELTGRVLDPEGEPVREAQIEATGVASDATPSGLPPGKGATTTDEEGDFVLHVNPGVYNVRIQPPEDAGLPAFRFQQPRVDRSLRKLTWHVPDARVLVGTLYDRGKPVADFTVNAFELVADTPSTTKPALQSGAITDAQGRFLLLLPDSP